MICLVTNWFLHWSTFLNFVYHCARPLKGTVTLSGPSAIIKGVRLDKDLHFTCKNKFTVLRAAQYYKTGPWPIFASKTRWPCFWQAGPQKRMCIKVVKALLRSLFILNRVFTLVPPGWPEWEPVFGNQVVYQLCYLLFQRRHETTALNKGLTMQPGLSALWWLT